MFKNYENKIFTRFHQGEEEKNKTKIMIEVGGKRYASFADKGETVMFRDGTKYLVSEDGSLRKIKP